MAVRIRYVRTELSEGVVETLYDVDKFEISDDNTLVLKAVNPESGKYRTVGFVHPQRWESVVLVENENAND